MMQLKLRRSSNVRSVQLCWGGQTGTALNYKFSELSRFSVPDEAFRFYLPAYLIADIDGKLGTHDPVFHLTHGLTDDGRGKRVNPRRYGERTWFDEKGHKFAVFDPEQARAIVSYLELKRETDEFQCEAINQALANYWSRRAEASPG